MALVPKNVSPKQLFTPDDFLSQDGASGIHPYKQSSSSHQQERAAEVKPRTHKPNCYMGLGINPVELDRKLHKIINGTGGKIEQMFLYLSPANAEAWLSETSSENFKAAVDIPVNDIVDGILQRMEKMTSSHPSIELISLGAGEAKQEQRIIQKLMQSQVVEAIRLFLIDSSYPLLNLGLTTSEEILKPYAPHVETYAVYQDFYTLPQNRPFLESLHESNRIRLVTMLGQTFPSLDEDTLFVRDVLKCFSSGTLLLLDICPPFAPADNPEEIKRKDPQLGGRYPWVDFAEKFWTVPFVQHHPSVKSQKDITFSRVFDTSTSRVSGSYSIEVRACIGPHEFVVRRFIRHPIQGLIEAFAHEGWSHVNTYPLHEKKRLAVLFQKQ